MKFKKYCNLKNLRHSLIKDVALTQYPNSQPSSLNNIIIFYNLISYILITTQRAYRCISNLQYILLYYTHYYAAYSHYKNIQHKLCVYHWIMKFVNLSGRIESLNIVEYNLIKCYSWYPIVINDTEIQSRTRAHMRMSSGEQVFAKLSWVCGIGEYQIYYTTTNKDISNQRSYRKAIYNIAGFQIKYT